MPAFHPKINTKHRNQSAPLTSIVTPGINMTTASPWKNFLLAFTLSVGTCLSAASSRSAATFATLTPLGRFGRLGRFGNATPKALAEDCNDCTAEFGVSLVCEIFESGEIDADMT